VYEEALELLDGFFASLYGYERHMKGMNRHTLCSQDINKESCLCRGCSTSETWLKQCHSSVFLLVRSFVDRPDNVS